MCLLGASGSANKGIPTEQIHLGWGEYFRIKQTAQLVICNYFINKHIQYHTSQFKYKLINIRIRVQSRSVVQNNKSALSVICKIKCSLQSVLRYHYKAPHETTKRRS